VVYVEAAIGAAGVGFMERVKGAFTSTFTGGAIGSALEIIPPQLKQYFASPEFSLPQT
jgi:hypothetical protein